MDAEVMRIWALNEVLLCKRIVGVAVTPTPLIPVAVEQCGGAIEGR